MHAVHSSWLFLLENDCHVVLKQSEGELVG